MEDSKLEHFKQLLLAELPGHARHVSEEQAAALDAASDDAKESADLAMRDVTEEMALKLGDRESQMLADIDQALLRIEEGSYGVCVRCGGPLTSAVWKRCRPLVTTLSARPSSKQRRD